MSGSVSRQFGSLPLKKAKRAGWNLFPNRGENKEQSGQPNRESPDQDSPGAPLRSRADRSVQGARCRSTTLPADRENRVHSRPHAIGISDKSLRLPGVGYSGCGWLQGRLEENRKGLGSLGSASRWHVKSPPLAPE